MSFDSYYNEMYLRGRRRARRTTGRSPTGFRARRPDRIHQMRQAAQLLFHRVGITFAVYGEDAGAERLIPFDMLPHIIPVGGMARTSPRACASAPGR